jgi:DNA polymerase-3 subunit gamma/tau
MSYQVLARKWRPKTFKELKGQIHISQSLTHSLEQGRLHHAYLFDGKQGVGKTTIARILTKCLNCEQGIVAEPCDRCDACQKITEGRFVDFIEIDAASRTKVEDTRELLEKVPYPPAQGRFKVYLIDEVHMLSGHSFNALLKTLEEPPEHVKFILATTDPQKLPITVLSRCLQFHLKPLPPHTIQEYLISILEAEHIPFETDALLKIARAAKGSMRDALSLLDQAIAFCQGQIQTKNVYDMLGNTDEMVLQTLLGALLQKEGQQILALTDQLAKQGTNFEQLLSNLIRIFHALAISQVSPAREGNDQEFSEITTQFSHQFSAEDIQLFYQIALLGYKELNWFEEARIGFEMTLLRMLTFQPVIVPIHSSKPVIQSTPIIQSETKQVVVHSEKKAPRLSPTKKSSIPPPTCPQISDWKTLLTQLNLSGMLQVLATNCALKETTPHSIKLVLRQKHAALLNDKLRARLNEILNQYFKQTLQLIINVENFPEDTPAQTFKKQQSAKQAAAFQHLSEDQQLQTMLDAFDATLDPNLVTLKTT